jgi:hypothetical protein
MSSPFMAAYSARPFMPAYSARQRFQVDSETSSWRRTSVKSLPSLSSFSPSRTLRRAYSGLCRWRFIAVCILPLWDLDAHKGWTEFRALVNETKRHAHSVTSVMGQKHLSLRRRDHLEFIFPCSSPI